EDYETWDEDRPAPTLNEFDNGDVRTTTAVVFDPSRRDGARPQLDGTRNTLTGHMGTGGNNTPMVAQTRAIGIQGKNIGRQDKNTTNGKGHTEEGEPMFTLTSTDQHAVAVDTYNQTTETEHDHPPIAFDSTWSNYTTPSIDLSPTVKVGSGLGIPSPPAVAQHDLSVRRLTPLECERLQGWPDNHTLNRADGKENSDSQRYKQCGNGVAAPVAQWVAKHLRKVLCPTTNG
ncbi:MAG: DNA cytosine methyltransferase, partial [Ilumatobacteraceae bacterium]